MKDNSSYHLSKRKAKNLRWDRSPIQTSADWGSLGWQGFVMFVKHTTRDGVISVKAASDCQTSHCGSTPVTPLDNRFEADTVWFPRAALFYVVRARHSALCGNTLVSRAHTFQAHVHAATLLVSINFQDGLNKGPWWRHLESYYLGLMNFWQRAVWFMIPNTRPMSSSYIDHILLHFCALKMFGLLFALDLLCRVIVFKLNLWYCLEKKKLRLCLNQPHEQDESFPQLIKF